nr:MAG TPA: Sulfotransferase family [Caudoviricetes sp.]
MNYSDRMKAYMAENGIDDKGVVYLTIAREPLERIISGDKTVEFRDFSDFYVKKLLVVSDGEVVGAKPFTHILFQAGYSTTAPRALVEIADIKIKLPEDTAPQSAVGKAMYAEAEVEGFEIDDAWIGIAIGTVLLSE